MPRTIRRSVFVLMALMLVASSGRRVPADAGTREETRALWVQHGTLVSAPAITALVEQARSAGFNTLLVQVRSRGDAYYVSRREPRGAALSKQDASFDPLALAIAAGHRAGLRVHAWVNVNLVSDAALPAARTHVVYRHPEWLMVPRDLVDQAARLNPRSPAYAAMLSAYARANSDRIEGLYLSPLQSAAADYTVSVVRDIAAQYRVDGIHLDYARFPNEDFDYSLGALAQFQAEIWRTLSPDERREYRRRSQNRVLFYTQMFPQRWQEFRQARMTLLVSRMREAIKRRNPGALLSAAVWPDPESAALHRMQDWSGWLEHRLLDAVCPMAYTSDAAQFRAQIGKAKEAARGVPVWAGIGAYHLSAADTIANIDTARRLGAQGVSLFSYDNLTPQVNTDPRYFSKVAQGAFAR